ncbi:hypothetical protein AGMMS50262_23700 [Bacteroidia bacterium]|nr:hypothetical protein AGMMS50262_23700 [Bacteroidia bacterium]
MVKLKEILLVLFTTVFIGCSTAQMNQNSHYNGTYEDFNLGIELGQDTFLLNNEINCRNCDSLYNSICRPTVFFGDPENLPQFLGGYEALMIFISDHIQYPVECKEKVIQGRVIVRFIIDESGQVICPHIQRSLHPAADEEALRIVGLMPVWKPASNSGILCKMCYTLPVLFKLDTTEENTNFFKRIFRKIIGK